MLDPKDMTEFQKIVEGLRVLQGYLSDENQGDIACEHDEIYVSGVHRDALGGDDRAKLEAMGWQWHESFESWWRFV
jgi:hypothetical protein